MKTHNVRKIGASFFFKRNCAFQQILEGWYLVISDHLLLLLPERLHPRVCGHPSISPLVSIQKVVEVTSLLGHWYSNSRHGHFVAVCDRIHQDPNVMPQRQRSFPFLKTRESQQPYTWELLVSALLNLLLLLQPTTSYVLLPSLWRCNCKALGMTEGSQTISAVDLL